MCINRTTLEFTNAQIKSWLDNFGKIEGQFEYQTDKLGFITDDLEVELKLEKHIPEYLPMYGRKIRIFYAGMPKQCNNCLEQGHLKFECENEKKDWFSYIEELISSGNFNISLFGEWPEIIKNKKKNGKNEQTKSGIRGRGRGRGRGQS